MLVSRRLTPEEDLALDVAHLASQQLGTARHTSKTDHESLMPTLAPSDPSSVPAPDQGAPEQDGLLVVVKKDCPTCRLIVPALEEILANGLNLVILSQDDPAFPELQTIDSNGQPTGQCKRAFDDSLERSHRLKTEVVPTLYVMKDGAAQQTAIGWNRAEWRQLTELDTLGEALPGARPGCGSLNLEPANLERLELQTVDFTARRLTLGDEEDEFEAAFAREWTDGLPVVPPTPERVYRMLQGTARAPEEVVGRIAPDQVNCTVEKVAINAVMAGCRPEYLPVVLAAVQAACDPAFNWHGLAATTYFSGPVVVVNGPIAQRLGMNSGINALGQGNRANMTIGRALNLTLRNVGGARPGEIDRATMGNPGKLSFCFAENESDSPWSSLSESRGIAASDSAVTLFAGEGPRGLIDQLSREPESLCRSFAMTLRTVAHPKLILGFDAILVVSPEHGRIFKEASWSRDDLTNRLHDLLQLPTQDLVRGAGGCAEGVPEALAATETMPKFKPDGLLIVHAGGKAGLFSAIIGGWVNGEIGSTPVTRSISG